MLTFERYCTVQYSQTVSYLPQMEIFKLLTLCLQLCTQIYTLYKKVDGGKNDNTIVVNNLAQVINKFRKNVLTVL